MDQKDASEQRPEEHDDIEECDEGIARACIDIWACLLIHLETEDGPDYLGQTDEEDVLEALMGLSDGIRYFRYTGHEKFEKLEDAWRGVFDRFFWAPDYAWVNGHFYDIPNLAKVVVGGVVKKSSGLASRLP